MKHGDCCAPARRICFADVSCLFLYQLATRPTVDKNGPGQRHVHMLAPYAVKGTIDGASELELINESACVQ